MIATNGHRHIHLGTTPHQRWNLCIEIHPPVTFTGCVVPYRPMRATPILSGLTRREDRALDLGGLRLRVRLGRFHSQNGGHETLS